MEANENSVSANKNLRVKTNCVSFVILFTIFVSACFILNNVNGQSPISNNLFGNITKQSASTEPFLGINMRGYYTNMPQSREGFEYLSQTITMKRFQTISKAHAIDHLRYRFYWESYVRNSTAFMNEIEQVANAGHKYGIKIVYDNHQFHTSSWLNVDRGTGFPVYLFNNPSLYPQDSGGARKSAAAESWWTKIVEQCNKGKWNRRMDTATKFPEKNSYCCG